MTLVGLSRVHARMARRQKALWFTTVPLTALAALIAIGNRSAPGTGGVEDLAFTGQMLAIFTGIAYTAAFADFFTTPAKLGVHELEASAPITPVVLRLARVLGSFLIVTLPSFVVLLVMGIVQTVNGSPWSIPGAVAVMLTVVGPAALIAMTLSGLAGAVLPSALGRIVAVVLWFALVLSSPMIPIPTPNGTVFNVIGDAILPGYFGTSPTYAAAGPLGFDGTPVGATVSLILQIIVILVLLVAGSVLAERSRKR